MEAPTEIRRRRYRIRLWSYAFATRCPVLTWRMLLPGEEEEELDRMGAALTKTTRSAALSAYAMSGDPRYPTMHQLQHSSTDLANGTPSATCCGMSGTNLVSGTARATSYGMSSTNPVSSYPMSGTDLARAAIHLVYCPYTMSGMTEHMLPVLRACYALSGTGLAYPACVVQPVLRICHEMSGTYLAFAARIVPFYIPLYAHATRCLYGGRLQPEKQAPGPRSISLRACYAKSGTDLAYAAARLVRVPQGYVPTVDVLYVPPMVLRACYAKSGTEAMLRLYYTSARRCPVLT
eukprot:2914893-Rhodomonas_salina.2